MYALDLKMFKYIDGDLVGIKMYYIQGKNVDSNKTSNTSDTSKIFWSC